MKLSEDRPANVLEDPTGKRRFLVWLADTCNAEGCKKPKDPRALICSDCFFDGWSEVSSEFEN